MTNAPPLTFTLEEDGRDGTQVELVEHDLPRPPLQWGGQLDETVTRYSNNETSVQVHGVELEPVHIEGRLDDAWWGAERHALDQKEVMLDLLHTGGLVRMDYGEDRLWGTFHVTFNESRRDRIEYSIDFRPYWAEPPEAEGVMSFSPAADDDATIIFTELEVMHGMADEAPDEVSDSLTESILRNVLRAMNHHATVLNKVSGVQNYANLASDSASVVRRSARATHARLSRLSSRLKSISQDAVSGDGAARMRAQSWATDMERRSRTVSADVLEFVRKLEEALRPSSTRTYVVARGDTLQSIAREQLGDFSRWTEIADRNDLETTNLEVGQSLEIPPR